MDKTKVYLHLHFHQQWSSGGGSVPKQLSQRRREQSTFWLPLKQSQACRLVLKVAILFTHCNSTPTYQLLCVGVCMCVCVRVLACTMNYRWGVKHVPMSTRGVCVMKLNPLLSSSTSSSSSLQAAEVANFARTWVRSSHSSIVSGIGCTDA